MSTDEAKSANAHHYLGAVQTSPAAVLAYRKARELYWEFAHANG